MKDITQLLAILKAADAVGYPGILKTSTQGYDGKGQWKFNSREDVLRLIYKSRNDDEPTPEALKEISEWAASVFAEVDRAAA